MNRMLPWILAAGLFGSAAAGAEPGATACLKPATWLTPGKTEAASGPAVLAEMARRDVVLLGEHHDDDDHHRWQLQVLAALHARRPEMVIGFEMFPRRVQPVLDRWVAGELTVRQFLEQAEWEKVWNQPAELYLPLFQFARVNRIPMLALNVDQKLTRAIAEQGWDAIPAAEREGVGRAAPAPTAYRDFLFDIYREHAARRGEAGAAAAGTDVAFGRFVESQTTWDRAMAEALARGVATPAGRPLAVGIMGSGHLRFGHGVAHQLADLGVGRVGTLLPLPVGYDCSELRAGLADAVFTLPPQATAPPEPPRLGIRLEENAGGLRIAEVTAGSLAERSGLKSGDHLVEAAGAPAAKVPALIALVRQQPAGTWLPLRVRRGEEVIDLVVKFPART